MCLIFHNFSLFPFFFFLLPFFSLKHPVEWDENPLPNLYQLFRPFSRPAAPVQRRLTWSAKWMRVNVPTPKHPMLLGNGLFKSLFLPKCASFKFSQLSFTVLLVSVLLSSSKLCSFATFPDLISLSIVCHQSFPLCFHFSIFHLYLSLDVLIPQVVTYI